MKGVDVSRYLGSLALLSIVGAATSPAVAQTRRAGLAFEGPEADTAPLADLARGVLAGSGFEVVDDAELRAARAFQGTAEGPFTDGSAAQLRGAIRADLLVVITVRAPDEATRQVAIRRVTEAGVQTDFGEASPDALPALVAQRLTAALGAQPPPSAADPPPSGAPPPGTPQAAVPIAVSPIGAATPLPTQPSPMADPMADSAPAQPRRNPFEIPSIVLGSAALLSWVATMLIGPLVICAETPRNCTGEALYSLIPLVGPYLAINNNPVTGPGYSIYWSGGAIVSWMTLGIIQDILFPVAIVFMALMGSWQNPDAPPPTSLDFVNLPGGGELVFTTRF